MTCHYLVDLFGNAGFPVNVSIIDVREPDSGQSLANGSMVVRVPDYIQVVRPTDLQDLLNQKYTGLLAFYAGFAEIAADDLIDPLHVDLVNSAGVRAGLRNTVCIANGGFLRSTAYSLLPSPAPTVAVITWEVFEYVDTDPKTGMYEREYKEVSASEFTCEISFDNWVNTNFVVNEGIFNVPLGQQGTDLIIRFTNTSAPGRELFLGSWAVIY